MSRAADYETPVEDMTSQELYDNALRIHQDRLNEMSDDELKEENIKLGVNTKPNMKHECPDCSEMIYEYECPKEAPDFVCEYCHIRRYYFDPDWRQETDERRKSND